VKISAIKCFGIVVGFAGMMSFMAYDNPNELLVFFYAAFFMIQVLVVFAQTATQFYELLSGTEEDTETDDDLSITI
jgi:hypothetical protein